MDLKTETNSSNLKWLKLTKTFFIAIYYYLEITIDKFHKEKKYCKICLMYIIFLIITTGITSINIHFLMIGGICSINFKGYIQIKKYIELNSYLWTLGTCFVVILYIIVQNAFNTEYNPMRSLRLIIQSLLYKFDIKKFFIMMILNLFIIDILNKLTYNMFVSYIKYREISVHQQDLLEILRFLIIFIVFYNSYVWGIQDKFIRCKRRLCMNIVASSLLLFTTVKSLYELFLKNGTNFEDIDYIKVIAFIVALILSVDKVFDSLKSLMNEYSEQLVKRNIIDSDYCFIRLRAAKCYKDVKLEMLNKKKVEIINEFNRLKNMFFSLNKKDKFKFIGFINIIVVLTSLISYITSKFTLPSSRNIEYINLDKLYNKFPEWIKRKFEIMTSGIMKIVTYVISVIILVSIFGAGVQSIITAIFAIKKAFNEKYSLNIWFQNTLYSSSMNLIAGFVLIFMAIVGSLNFFSINLTRCVVSIMMIIEVPLIITFIVSLIVRKLSEKVNEYKNN